MPIGTWDPGIGNPGTQDQGTRDQGPGPGDLGPTRGLRSGDPGLRTGTMPAWEPCLGEGLRPSDFDDDVQFQYYFIGWAPNSNLANLVI